MIRISIIIQFLLIIVLIYINKIKFIFFRDAVQNDAPKSSRSKDYIKGRGRGNTDRGSDRGRGRGSSNLIQVY